MDENQTELYKLKVELEYLKVRMEHLELQFLDIANIASNVSYGLIRRVPLNPDGSTPGV